MDTGPYWVPGPAAFLLVKAARAFLLARAYEFKFPVLLLPG
jgi:hypothetical protein